MLTLKQRVYNIIEMLNHDLNDTQGRLIYSCRRNGIYLNIKILELIWGGGGGGIWYKVSVFQKKIS